MNSDVLRAMADMTEAIPDTPDHTVNAIKTLTGESLRQKADIEDLTTATEMLTKAIEDILDVSTLLHASQLADQVDSLERELERELY